MATRKQRGTFDSKDRSSHGMLYGGLRMPPTRFAPVTTVIPWMKDKGRLRYTEDKCNGDTVSNVRTRNRRSDHTKRETPIPRCLGCERQVRIVTDEDLLMPLCEVCVLRDDEFLQKIAMKLAAYQVEAELLRAEKVQEIADWQFGPLDGSDTAPR